MKHVTIGFALLLFSLIYLFLLFKRNNKEIKNLNAWDLSMLLKGVVGGILLLIIGILLFINEIKW